MLRSRRLVLALVCTWLSACSMVVDFDRTKIDRGDAGGDVELDGGMDGGNAHADSGPGSDSGTDGALADADTRNDGGDTGPTGCVSNEECTADALCCGGECVDTTFERCGACDQGCSVHTAAACVNRSCECEAGSGEICGSDAPFCNGTDGAKACVECREETDCAGRADDKLQCLDNVCVACNPTTHAGCSGDAPICNAATFTCEKCTMGAGDNCDAPLVCTASGACGGCADSAVDCKTPTAPICDGSTKCQACTDDDECDEELNRPYCLTNSGRCAVCRPNTEAGCNEANKPDCRMNATTDRYECQACSADVHCANRPDKHCQTEDGARKGQCVECTEKAHCATVTGKNECDLGTNTCVACLNNAQCGGVTPICDAESNTCRGCTGASDCGGATPACNTGSGQCVACIGNAQCGGGTPHCDTTAHVCRACLNDAQCGGATPICDAASNTCRGCTGASDCGGATPACNTDSGQCVACIGNAQCGGATPICGADNTCRGCTVATEATDCTSSSAPACDASTGACVACRGGNLTACTDGTNCTTAGCSASHACEYTPKPVDDDISCTTDSCDPATGDISNVDNCADGLHCIDVGATHACRECDATHPCPEGEICNAAFACEPEPEVTPPDGDGGV